MPPRTTTTTTKDKLLPATGKAAAAWGLRFRGLFRRAGGGATTDEPSSPVVVLRKTATTTANDKDFQKTRIEALESIQFCWKCCAFAIFLGVALVPLESMVLPETATLPWNAALDFWYLLDVLSGLGFGFGLWRVSKMYQSSLKLAAPSSKSNNIPAGMLRSLLETMRSVWGYAAFNMVISTMVLTVINPTPPYKITVHNPILLYVGPGGMLAASLLGGVLIRESVKSRFNKILDEFGKKMDDLAQQEIQKPSLRFLGFSVTRNLSYFIGGLVLYAGTRLVKIAATGSMSLVDKVFDAFDSIELLAIAGLLGRLNKAFLRAVLTATSSRGGDNGGAAVDSNAYFDLFEAQKNVYRRIGYVILSACLVEITPVLGKVLGPLFSQLSSVIWKA